jgi:hypothetical protein
MEKCISCEEKQKRVQAEIYSFLQSELNGDKPFEDMIINDNLRLRKFSKDVDPFELKWHVDEEERIIRAINENDWQFQFDNELPITMEVNKAIYIPKGLWHRSIKGSTDLIISIEIPLTES